MKMNIFPDFVLKRFNTFLAIIVVFVYKVMIDKDLECTCKDQSLDCTLYMALPFFILFVLHLWVDKRFQRIWRFTFTTSCDTCNKMCDVHCKFIWILLYEILKAAFIGQLWVIFVLLDGDWYVCCLNDGSQQAQLACKNHNNITAEEKANIAGLKNKSKRIGLCVLFFTILAFSIISTFRWRRCVQSPCCNRKILYDKMILEEEENVLKEVLRNAAKVQLTEEIKSKITGKHWEECFNAAEDLVTQTRARPTLPPEQEEGRPPPPPPQDQNEQEPGPPCKQNEEGESHEMQPHPH